MFRAFTPLSAILVFGLLLQSCGNNRETVEEVYDLPAENYSIAYDQLFIEGSGTMVISYRLPDSTKNSAVFLRSQQHNYKVLSEVAKGFFQASVNTASLKKGVYEIGICPDIAAPEVVFTATFLGTLPQLETIKVDDASQILYSIEKFTADPSKVRVQGWAYLKNKPMTSKSITIGLAKNDKVYFYETELQERNDVTSYFKPEFNADFSGFHAVVPLKNVPPGSYDLGIRITDLADSSYEYINTSRKVILPHQLDSIPTATPNISYNLEQFSASDEAIQLKGWAYLGGSSVNEPRIFILMKADVVYAVPVDVIERKDVTAYFKSPYNIDRCGFSVTFDRNMLPDKNMQVGILVVDGMQYGVVYSDKVLSIQQ